MSPLNAYHCVEIIHKRRLLPQYVRDRIHWISDIDAVPVFYEIYSDLAPNGEFDPSSKKIHWGYIQKYALEPSNINKIFQLERVGYFKFDRYEKSDTNIYGS